MTTETPRDIAMRHMPAPLVTKLVDVEEAIETLRSSTIKSHHKLGKTLKMVQDDPGRYNGTDGTPGIELLLKAVGSKSAAVLRDALRFADQYTTEEMVALVELSHKKTGFSLVWRHVHILLTITAKSDRKKWTARIIREEMSPTDFHSALKKEEGREDGHGRPFNIPPTITKQLSGQDKDLTAFIKKNEQIWNGSEHSTFVNIMTTPVEEVDDDWLLQLEEIVGKLTSVMEVVRKNIADATEGASRIRSVIDAREAEATREAASVTVQASSGGRSNRVVQLADDEDDMPVVPVRRSAGRRTVAEV